MSQVIPKLVCSGLSAFKAVNNSAHLRIVNQLVGGVRRKSCPSGDEICPPCISCCMPKRKPRKKPPLCPLKPCPKVRYACDDAPDHCPYTPPPCLKKCVYTKRPRLPPAKCCEPPKC